MSRLTRNAAIGALTALWGASIKDVDKKERFYPSSLLPVSAFGAIPQYRIHATSHLILGQTPCEDVTCTWTPTALHCSVCQAF